MIFHCNCFFFLFYVFNKKRSITLSLRENYKTEIPHLLNENKVPEVLLRRYFFFQSALKVYIESNVDVHS